MESNQNIDATLWSPSGRKNWSQDVAKDVSSFRLTETGTYQLIVDGTNENTDNYAFRLLDWSEAISLNLNTTISEPIEISGKEDRLYQFEALKGQRLYFKGLTVSAQNEDIYQLYNTQGQSLFSEKLDTDTEYVLEKRGTYYLAIRDSQETSFALTLTTPEILTTSLNLGDLITDEISQAGERDNYTFEGSVGQQFYLETLTDNSQLFARLYAPSGKLLFSKATSDNDTPFTLIETGTYRLEIDGEKEATGEYSVKLSNLETVTPLISGETITDTLDEEHPTKLYQFIGTKGSQLSFDWLEQTGDNQINWTLYDPNNHVLKQPDLNAPDFQVALPSDGLYTLAIVRNSNTSIDYSFQVTDNSVASIPITGTNVTVTGTIANAGDVDSYTFNASAGTLIRLDRLSTSSWQIRARLRNPDGTYLFENHDTRNDYGVIRLDQTGEYSLETSGYFSSTIGNWQFQIIELVSDPTSPQFNPQPFNAIETDTLTPENPRQIYQIEAIVGQQLLFNGMDGERVNASLYDPNGNRVFYAKDFRQSNIGLPTLTQDGIYNLVIEADSNNSTSNYSFQLINLATGSPIPINLPVSGRLSTGQQSKVYQLVAEKANQTFFFDIEQSSSKANIKIYSSNYETLLHQSPLKPDESFELSLPDKGIYTVLIEGDTLADPIDYQFQVFVHDKTPASVIVPGTGESNQQEKGTLGTFPVKITVEDGQGGSAIQDYRLRLWPDPDNTAPSIISTPSVRTSLTESIYRYQLDSLDPDGDALTYRLLDSPLDAFISQDTGELLWFTDESAEVGNTYDFTVEVSDGRGGIDIQSFSVEVFDQLGTIEGLVFEDINRNTFLDLNLVQGDNPDVFFVIEYSCAVAGGNIDWTTADLDETFAHNLTPVDLELGAILLLSEYLIAQGFGHTANIGILDGRGNVFDLDPSQEGLQITTNPLADNNNNGIADLREALRRPVYGSSPTAVVKAIELHQELGLSGDLNVMFMSSGNFTLQAEEKEAIDLAVTQGVNVSAFSFSFRAMEKMRSLDPDATLIKSTQQIYDIFSGNVLGDSFDPKFLQEPLLEGITVYLDLNNNGILDSHEPQQVTQIPDNSLDVSDASFSFRFDNLLPGTYIVRQVVPERYEETTPTSGSFVDVITVSENTFYHQFGLAKKASAQSLPPQAPVFTSTAPTGTLTVGEQLFYQVQATDADNDALTFELAIGPQGMVLDAESGILLWEPTIEQAETLPGVLIRVTDDQGGVATQYFELEVIAPNTPPLFTSTVPNISPQVGKLFSYQAKALDADGDILTYHLDTDISGITLDENTGLLRWTPTATDLGEQNLTIIAQDEKGGEIRQDLTLNVIDSTPNRLPDIVSTPVNFAPVNRPYLYQPVTVDEDGNPLTLTLDQAPDGMIVDEQGRIIWMPTIDQVGEHQVQLTVDDGQGGLATQTFTVVVQNRVPNLPSPPPETPDSPDIQPSNPPVANHPPTITSSPNTSIDLNRIYQYSPTAQDPDGHSLFWQLESAPAGMVIDEDTGAIRWQPQPQQLGEHTVILAASDVLGQRVTQTFTLTVTGENTPPLISSIPSTKAGIDQVYTYQAIAADAEADQLFFSLGIRPDGMTIDENTGEIRWTPQTGQVGSYQVEVIVRDTQGAISNQTYTLVVESQRINQAPTISSKAVLRGGLQQGYTYQVTANDPDGEALTYQLLSHPQGMTIDENTGLVQWQPQSDQLGQFDIAVAAIDSDGAGTVQAFSISIQPQNQPPVITSTTPPTVTTPQTVYRYDLHVRELDGEKLTYSLVQGPSGMTIDELGRVRWTPNAENTGNYPIEIAVTDSLGATVTQSFTLEVVADTLAPTVRVNPSVQPVDLGQSVTLYVRATDNIGVSTLSLTVNGQAVSLDGNGLYTFTPDTVGTIEAIATATDAAGNSQSAITTFEVLDFSDEDAPIINLPAFSEDTVTSPTEIIGTVNDDNLQYYTLEVAKLGSDDFQEVFRGTQAVDNDVLGVFDPTLLENDAYTLRLKAVDAGGNIVFEQRTINVEGDLKLGNFQLSFTDLSIPVSGIPISITRTYDTLTAQERDDFGYGWRLEFRDTNLRTSLGPDDYYDTFDIIGKGFREGDKVYITLPGGKRETFTFKPELDLLGAFLAAAGGGLGIQEDTGLYHPKFVSESDSNNVLTVKDALLIRTGTGEFAGIPANLYNPIDPYFGRKYTLTTGEGIVYEIDALSGDLLTATDTNGNKLTFSESGIISDSGVEVKFNRDAKGRITSIVDPSGNIIQYEYDSNGDLIKVIDREENETKFDYHEEREHYLETIIDPLNREAVRTEYDEDGRLSRVIDVNEEAVELVYDPDNSTQTTKDVFGNETIYVYDERGNILTEVDAVGKVTKRTYDEENNLLTETIITEESGEEGYTTTYTYDARGNALTETNALGNITRYTYGKFDHVLTETDTLGNTTTYDYGFATGNLLSTKDAQGNINKFSYDRRGNLLSLTDADNNITRFEYDLRGNVTRIIDANGHQTNYTYDDSGNQLTESKTVTTAEGIVTVLTQNTYDKQGNLLSTTDAENNTTYYEYNELNQQTAVIDALLRRTEYRYDDKGQLVETIYPDSTPETLDDNPRTITVYDRGSRQKATIDQAGKVTYYNYDQLGRLIETIYTDEVDTLSQFVSFLDSNKTVTIIDWTEVIYPDSNPSYLSDNPRTQTEYYQDGKIKANINERGYRTEYIYDANDQLIEIIYPELADNPGINFTTTNTYDVVGRKIAETDALGRTTNYVYDELGRLTKTLFADGTFTTSSYDKLGRRTTTTDQEGKITNYEYDSLGRLTDVVQYLNQNSSNPTEIRTEYGYDELGRLIWVEDANNHKTNYEYDKVGRRTAIELPLGQRSITTYDAVGNIETVTDFNEKIITYFYDVQNRLIKKLFADNSFVDYTYTLTGLRETITDSRGTTTYTYDERDRLIAQTDPTGIYLDSGNTLEYSYDLTGNRTSVTTPSGTVYYTFDEWNRLKTVTDADNHQTIYVYDGVSNLIETTFSNGVIETRDYDDLNRLIKLENKLGEQVISGYEYTLDKVGHRLKVEEADGRIVEYDYDDLYRLIEETITDSSDTVNDGRVISYTYDAVGNRLTKIDSVEGTITYVYNANDWLLTETQENGEVKEYEYDDNGNTIKVIEDSAETIYEWDKENRLVSVTLSDGTEINYEYDVNNIRTSQEVNGVRTDYLVDSNQAYAQVLEEYVDGELEVSYVYGLDLISQERNDETTFYQVDGLGSARVLTNENGLVISSYDYDAFGNLINSNNSFENNYLFAGEQFDENLGEYYLRDRYYDQSIGRFTRRDTYEGGINSPITLHKYLYANADPVNGIDPSGLVTLTELNASSSLQDQLQAINTSSVTASSQQTAAYLLKSNILHPQAIQTMIGRGLINPKSPFVQRTIQTVIQSTDDIVVQAWTNGAKGAKSHFFNRMLEQPQRFVEIANRLREPAFRYGAGGFKKFTQLAQQISKLPKGASRFGQVFKSPSGNVTFVRTSKGTGKLLQSGLNSGDEGVMVIRDAAGKIKTFSEVASGKVNAQLLK
ncbi:putative Ig domain-containing protein [Crocosphaera sp. Alani8]|uniref:putative Ig domain-containing protein n=4 Tax=Crocosphaera TaxID=263510 RepID=UPI00313C03E4